MLASWNALTQISPGARLVRSRAVAAAVFPAWAPLNNAILLGVPDSSSATAAVTELAALYGDAGVDTWALWLPARATDLDASDALPRVLGLKRDTTTLVMVATLAPGLRRDDRVVRTSVGVATQATDEPVPVADLPEPDGVPGFAAWVIVVDDLAVAGAWSVLHEGDCGVYTVGAVPAWRRRGLARALTEHVLAEAHRHGARTATLQSTRMGQPLYETLGFVPVGRYEEWLYDGTVAAT